MKPVYLSIVRNVQNMKLVHFAITLRNIQNMRPVHYAIVRNVRNMKPVF